MLLTTWLDVGSAVLAIVAAVFWFLSAYGKIPPLVPYWDETPADDPFYSAFRFSAKMNRWAAGFSGAAAICVAVSTYLKLPVS